VCLCVCVCMCVCVCVCASMSHVTKIFYNNVVSDDTWCLKGEWLILCEAYLCYHVCVVVSGALVT
jgi:hypothetical protein